MLILRYSDFEYSAGSVAKRADWVLVCLLIGYFQWTRCYGYSLVRMSGCICDIIFLICKFNLLVIGKGEV